jgi:hypothetical protein
VNTPTATGKPKEITAGSGCPFLEAAGVICSGEKGYPGVNADR